MANGNVDDGDPRDFVEKMEKGVSADLALHLTEHFNADTAIRLSFIASRSTVYVFQSKRCAMFYGSQTGTAEEYAVRLAKEAKTRYGLSSLVCDPEEYEFDKLDQVPTNAALFFVVATYGEGEPTDNAQTFMDFIMEDGVLFSKGGGTLENLNYVVFGLGNKTYAYYNEVARKIDQRLEALGAKRIGERGEGDDDKSMEEDYLGWKDDMWEKFASHLAVEEGGAGDVADFLVTEVADHPPEKVYHGELSSRALLASAAITTTTKGLFDSKNPFPAPVIASKELFAVGGERNCVHTEFDITDSGMMYQHGDHVGIWPSNPDVEIERILSVLGLNVDDRRHAIIAIESLDPALAKVPFPTPATYEAIFRHYLDISTVASRQTLAFFARFAPTEEAQAKLTRWGTNKDIYAAEIDGPALRLAEVLQVAVGDSLDEPFSSTVWSIPFDRIVSAIPRLQPRYYSISSSSKLYPSQIHVTAVILKYRSAPSFAHKDEQRWVHGLSTNFILNVKVATEGTKPPSEELQPDTTVTMNKTPSYKLAGPRGHYVRENVYRVPIHVRRSTFRLPTSPKVPVIMIGPGTVRYVFLTVAPAKT